MCVLNPYCREGLGDLLFSPSIWGFCGLSEKQNNFSSWAQRTFSRKGSVWRDPVKGCGAGGWTAAAQGWLLTHVAEHKRVWALISHEPPGPGHWGKEAGPRIPGCWGPMGPWEGQCSPGGLLTTWPEALPGRGPDLSLFCADWWFPNVPANL